jgi:hypothetical protein
LAALVGENVTEMLQLAPVATVLPQLLLCANAAAPVPLNVMELTLSAEPPVLESCTTCAALVAPTFVVKLSDEDPSVAIGGARITVTGALPVADV